MLLYSPLLCKIIWTYINEFLLILMHNIHFWKWTEGRGGGSRKFAWGTKHPCTSPPYKTWHHSLEDHKAHFHCYEYLKLQTFMDSAYDDRDTTYCVHNDNVLRETSLKWHGMVLCHTWGTEKCIDQITLYFAPLGLSCTTPVKGDVFIKGGFPAVCAKVHFLACLLRFLHWHFINTGDLRFVFGLLTQIFTENFRGMS
jgi:hypothetical protein